MQAPVAVDRVRPPAERRGHRPADRSLEEAAGGAAVRRRVVLLRGPSGEPEDLPLDPSLALLQPLESGPVPLAGLHGCTSGVSRTVDQAGHVCAGVAGVTEESANGEQVLSGRFLLRRDGVAGVADLVLPVRELGLGSLVRGECLVLAAQDHGAGGAGDQELLDRARRRDRVHHGQVGVAARLHPEDGVAEQLTLRGHLGASSAQLGRDPVELGLGPHQRASKAEPLGTRVPQVRAHTLQVPSRLTEPGSGLVEPAGRAGDGSAGVLELVVRLVDLVLDLFSLLAQVVLVVGGRLRDGEGPDRHGAHEQRGEALATGRAERESRRTVGRGAGEGAHRYSQSVFGEVNASTVSAQDQTLMYLRVSRSVGISVSAGPRMRMPGGTVPNRASR